MKTLQRGFSLIELMIVIAIIGILAAIAIPSYQTYVMKAKVGNLITAVQGGQLAVEDYISSTGDLECFNTFNYSHSTPDSIDWVGAGYYDTGQCYVEADGLDADFGGDYFYLYYTSTTDSTGAISWQCNWEAGNTAAVSKIVPIGCIDQN